MTIGTIAGLVLWTLAWMLMGAAYTVLRKDSADGHTRATSDGKGRRAQA